MSGEGEQLVVLSARTPERLRHSAARLVAFLERAETARGAVGLADLAFTLQVGREAMKERLAVTVASLPELLRVLRGYAESGAGAGTPGLHRGSAGQGLGVVAEISADDDLRELLVDRWVRKGKLDKLAALWVDGVELDWRRTHRAASPRRISLPTYPFARDRFWIGDLEPVRETAPGAAPATAAPQPEKAAPQSEKAGPHVTPDAASDPAHDFTSDAALDVTREERVARTVRATIADVLVMPPDEVDGGLAFADYGLDSILAVRLVHLLNETLRLDLSTGIVFDHSSADRLVAHLLAEYADIGAAVPEPAATETRPRTTSDSLRADRPAAHAPIAIVGMSGRFPGSDSLDDLWTHLANGDDLITEATRWDLADTGADGSARCTQGGFLHGIDRFDPLFFGISGVEAAAMDPQQRLLLEEAWKALEDAGYLRGSWARPAVACTWAATRAITRRSSGTTRPPRRSGGTWRPSSRPASPTSSI